MQVPVQNKDAFIASLKPYMPVEQSALFRLIEATPEYQRFELMLAIEELGMTLPGAFKLALQRKTFADILAACEPFEVDFVETAEDKLPHFKTTHEHVLMFDDYFRLANGEMVVDRIAIGYVLKLDDKRLRLTLVESLRSDRPGFVDELDVTEDSDDLQRVRIYKLIR